MTRLNLHKINKNFVVISSYNNDLHWVVSKLEDYFLYERGTQDVSKYGITVEKYQRTPNVGYNIYDYLTFIIENYAQLPPCILFMKGNLVPRHVSMEYFDKISNNNYFTPIIEPSKHDTTWPVCGMLSDTQYAEYNNSWYLSHFPVCYFQSLNEFLQFCFLNPVLPRYVTFAPGANYVVPRENLLRLPKVFYQNLRTFISYASLPGEAHIIERALSTIFTSNYEVSPAMMVPIEGGPLPFVMQCRSRNWRIIMDSIEFKVLSLFHKTLRKIHVW